VTHAGGPVASGERRWRRPGLAGDCNSGGEGTRPKKAGWGQPTRQRGGGFAEKLTRREACVRAGGGGLEKKHVPGWEKGQQGALLWGKSGAIRPRGGGAEKKKRLSLQKNGRGGKLTGGRSLFVGKKKRASLVGKKVNRENSGTDKAMTSARRCFFSGEPERQGGGEPHPLEGEGRTIGRGTGGIARKCAQKRREPYLGGRKWGKRARAGGGGCLSKEKLRVGEGR